MTNRLLEDLPMIEACGGVYIDSKACEKMWIEDDSKPEHLAEFLKLYPAGYHLSWVQAELGKWVALKHTFNNDIILKLLEPGKGQGKGDSGINQITTDFFIYLDVKEWVDKGYKLVGMDIDRSVFRKLQGLKKLTWKRFFQNKTLKGKRKRFRLVHHKLQSDIKGLKIIGNKQEIKLKIATLLNWQLSQMAILLYAGLLV